MDNSNLVALMQERLDLLKYLDYEALSPTDPKRAIGIKTTLAQTSNVLRMSLGDQSVYYLNFSRLSFYYEEGKRHVFEQNREIAVGILKNVLDVLQNGQV